MANFVQITATAHLHSQTRLLYLVPKVSSLEDGVNEFAMTKT
jgi:hypothetical protein